MLSKMVAVGDVTFPAFVGAQVYMHEFDFANPKLPEGVETFQPAFEALLAATGVTEGKGFLTIDQSIVMPGKSHRRGGPHVDGNYLFDWGGGGWLTGTAGRVLSEDNHQAQYCSEAGGIVIASDYSACAAWNGTYEGQPKQGGDCSHIDLSGLERFMLKPNTIYKGNHAIHESMPVTEQVKRTLMRITLPHTHMVFANA